MNPSFFPGCRRELHRIATMAVLCARLGLGVSEALDTRTAMNIYRDVVTDEMSTTSLKVAELAFHGNAALR